MSKDERKMPAFSIIPYESRYQPDFYRINAAWINKDFTLEAEDIEFLSHPERAIIAPGGMIFLLLEDENVAATCGVMKMDEVTYELVRMSVDTPFRGKSYGKKLVHHAIAWAKKQGATQIILETSSILTPAIRLYEGLGFKHYTPAAKHRSALARADVFMRLI